MLRGPLLMDDIRRANPPPGTVAFWWLGQASFVVKMAGQVAFIDPYLNPDERRQVKPFLRPEEVTAADLVLCTHDHADHLDPYAVSGLAAASPGAVFVVSRRHRQRMTALGLPEDRLALLDPGQSWSSAALRVTALKAKHEFFDDDDRGWPYLGFVIEGAGAAVYHSGDTVVYDGLEPTLSAWRLAVMFLPINGRDAERYRRNTIGNMTYQEAADLAGALRPKVIAPMHYDMFAGNAEDPGRFLAYLHVKFPGQRAWAGRPGERFEVAP